MLLLQKANEALDENITMYGNLRQETDEWVKNQNAAFDQSRREVNETLDKRFSIIKKMFDDQMSKVLVQYTEAIDKVSYQSTNLERF